MYPLFTADLHFGHEPVIHFQDRPFKNVKEMDEAIIDDWNSIVKRGDVVYVAGDYAWRKCDNLEKNFNRLNGQKHLIIGNHDWDFVRKLPWRSQDYIKHIRIRKNDDFPESLNLVLCHYALRTWNKSHYGSINLHGHSHGNMPSMKNSVDIGVDVAYRRFGSFRPFTLMEALELVKESHDVPTYWEIFKELEEFKTLERPTSKGAKILNELKHNVERLEEEVGNLQEENNRLIKEALWTK